MNIIIFIKIDEQIKVLNIIPKNLNKSEIDKDKFSDKEYVIINKSDIHDPESYDEMDNNFVSALYEIL